MNDDFVAEIENDPDDPFWLGHSSLPFRSDFTGDGFEGDEGVTVSRCGTEILVEACEVTLYLDLAEAITVWSSLKSALNEVRKVYQEQNRYLSERTEEGFAKKIEALPEDVRKAGKDAAGIARILEKVSADPVKEAFWVGNAATLLDQLRDSLQIIQLPVAAAQAKARHEKGEAK